jgi:hypothetical protein
MAPYETLLGSDLEIFRDYFKEALQFYGIPARYYQIKPGETFNESAELKAGYYDPKRIRVIFNQVPTVRTLKMLGWVTELDMDVQPIVDVMFDLPGLQVGCLISIKDPLNKKGRLFKITKMSVGILYPASVTCQLVPILGQDPLATTDPYVGEKSIFLNATEDPANK